MAPVPLPTIFVSHGTPTLPLEAGEPAREFLVQLGKRFSDIEAVLCISAHWSTREPAVNPGENLETIHDFSGFPPGLYRIRYPAHGAPDLGARIIDNLTAAGIPCGSNPERGLDHGAWVPLMLMFPDADIPVIQLSIQDHFDPAEHVALGEAIAPLREEGILILGSGGAVHPLGDPAVALADDAPLDHRMVAFNGWLNRAVTSGDRNALLQYRALAPSAGHAHPYPDHFMPLLVALGAAGPGAKGTILHQSWTLGNLGMGAFEFR